MARFAVEREVVIGRPYMLFTGGFMLAIVADLVLNQDVGLGDLFRSKEMIMLALGLVGLLAGYVTNMGVIRRQNYVSTGDVEEVTVYGGGLFVLMTIVNTLMANFRRYQASLQEQNIILVLSAPAFEEAFFRLFLTTILFFSFRPALIQTSRLLGLGEDSGRVMAAVMASVTVSITFMLFHGAVADISDPAIMIFYFVNSFAYCMVWLMTGNLMVTTTAHFMHNFAVVMALV